MYIVIVFFLYVFCFFLFVFYFLYVILFFVVLFVGMGYNFFKGNLDGDSYINIGKDFGLLMIC